MQNELDISYPTAKKRLDELLIRLQLAEPDEEEEVLDAEYEPFRDQLSLAGLSEEELRKMDPDDRVAALEQANLDPYDFIYLAC